MKMNIKNKHIIYIIGVLLTLFFLFYYDFSFKKSINSNLVLKKVEGGDMEEDYYLYDKEHFPVLRDVIKISQINQNLIVHSKDYQGRLGYFLVDENNNIKIITLDFIDSLNNINSNILEIWKID